MARNKVVRIALSGGIIGLLTTNPRRALENRISDENGQGWRCLYFLPHVDTNLLVAVLRIVVLVCTSFLWTWGAGYLILFEKDDGDVQTELLREIRDDFKHSGSAQNQLLNQINVDLKNSLAEQSQILRQINFDLKGASGRVGNSS